MTALTKRLQWAQRGLLRALELRVATPAGQAIKRDVRQALVNSGWAGPLGWVGDGKPEALRAELGPAAVDCFGPLADPERYSIGAVQIEPCPGGERDGGDGEQIQALQIWDKASGGDGWFIPQPDPETGLAPWLQWDAAPPVREGIYLYRAQETADRGAYGVGWVTRPHLRGEPTSAPAAWQGPIFVLDDLPARMFWIGPLPRPMPEAAIRPDPGD